MPETEHESDRPARGSAPTCARLAFWLAFFAALMTLVLLLRVCFSEASTPVGDSWNAFLSGLYVFFPVLALALVVAVVGLLQGLATGRRIDVAVLAVASVVVYLAVALYLLVAAGG